ncbi:MAG: TonB-dependent receptor [Pseudomonadota bacterium]
MTKLDRQAKKRFWLSTSSAAIALFGMSLGHGPALAQEAANASAADDEIDTIVVSGFRRSLENAIANKRDADTIVESISAEDIGRLPDISIADALARLPGITSQRTSGQSSAINIRGLSQQLTFTTLNGREQVTPNGNRSAEFEQFPSELISGAEIYKSPKASLQEGGLAGTVALRTIRPLDLNDRRVTINARGSYNTRADEVFDADDFGYRVSASYVDQFADGRFGIALGYARLVQPDVSTRFVGFDYDGFAPNDFNGDGQNDNVSFGFETEHQGGSDTRDGFIGTFQFRPTDTFEWAVDAYYSTFESQSFGRGIRVIGPQAANFGAPNTTVTDPVVVGSALVGGTFSRNVPAPTDPANPSQFGLTAQGINDNNFDDNETISIGSNFKWQQEKWTVSADFTYSRAQSDFANEVSAILPLTSLTGGVPGVSNDLESTPVLNDDLTISYLLQGTDIPIVNFSQDFTNRSDLFLSRFGVFPFKNDDQLFAGALDSEFETDAISFLRSIEMGFRYSQRRASQFRESADFGNDAGFFQFAGNAFTPIALTEQNSQVNCFQGEFAANGFPCYLVIEDPRSLVEASIGPIVADQSQGFTQTESFEVAEDVIAGYIQGNIETELFGVPLVGNAGVRIVQTDQQSVAISPGIPSGIKFTNFLPSINLIFELTERDKLRLSGSRALSRPPIFQLGSGFNISFNMTNNRLEGGGAGNPTLRPFLANQGDISYEHYFDNGGIFTVAAFYKSLQSFIVSETDPTFDFEPVLGVFLNSLNLDDANDAGQLEQFIAAGSPLIGQFGAPTNGEGGFVRGIEVAYAQKFDFLPSILSDFGITANYSYTDSQIDFEASNSGQNLNLPLPGLSDHVANATLFYEKGGFATRVGVRYRSEFISPQIGINQQLPFTDDEFVVDYQASYDFTDGPLGGVTLLFQANNVTDEPVATFFGQQAQTGTVQFFGRQIFFGASYQF